MRKEPRENYLFLAVESSDGEIMPDSVDRALKIAGIKGERFWPMSIDEIKKMTANMDIDIHSFHSLRYRSMWENEVLSFEDI